MRNANNPAATTSRNPTELANHWIKQLQDLLKEGEESSTEMQLALKQEKFSEHLEAAIGQLRFSIKEYLQFKQGNYLYIEEYTRECINRGIDFLLHAYLVGDLELTEDDKHNVSYVMDFKANMNFMSCEV